MKRSWHQGSQPVGKPMDFANMHVEGVHPTDRDQCFISIQLINSE